MGDASVVVPHYEATSSGTTVSEVAQLPEWFKTKVAQMEAADVCKDERELMQTCLHKQSYWAADCTALLESYDHCQQRLFTPSYRSMAEVEQIQRQLKQDT